MPTAPPRSAAGFDPERHARRLAPPGAALCVLAAAFGWPAAAVLAPAGLALLLVACYSRTDGLLVLGPFVRAETIRAARSRRPHLWRSLYAAGVLALLGLTYWNLSDRYGGPNARVGLLMEQVAVTFFAWFVGLQFAYLAYLTVNLIAPVVAEERETKRLDFLLSTDLRNREFLLGKAAARVPMLLDPLLASLPVLALLPFFGGVPPGFVVAAGVGTLATVMSLAGVAAFFSAVAPNAAKAIEWTYGMGMFYLVMSGVLWACAVWPPLWHFPSWFGVAAPFDLSDVVRVVSTGNPLPAFFLTVQAIQSGADPETTWQAAAGRYAVFHVGAFALFGLMAVARVRRAAAWDLERKPPAAAEPDGGEPAAEAEPAPGSRPARRGVVRRAFTKRRPVRPPVGEYPVLWYEAFRTSGLAGGAWAHEIGRPVFFGVMVVVAFNVLQLFFPQARELADGGVSLAYWGMGLAAMIAVPSRASGVIARERQVDTLDGLLLTGLGCREILRQKWWGVVAAHRALFGTMAGTALAGLMTGNLHPGTVVAHLLMVPVYLAAGAGVGLYFSVRASHPARAGWYTWVFIIVALIAVGTVTSRVARAGGGGRFDEVAGVAAVPPFATAMTAMGPLDWRRGRGGPPDGMFGAVALSLAAYSAVAGLFWRLAGDRFEAEWERRG